MYQLNCISMRKNNGNIILLKYTSDFLKSCTKNRWNQNLTSGCWHQNSTKRHQFHTLFLIAWLADGDSPMCCIVMMGSRIADMFSTFSQRGYLFLMSSKRLMWQNRCSEIKVNIYGPVESLPATIWYEMKVRKQVHIGTRNKKDNSMWVRLLYRIIKELDLFIAKQ